MLGFYVINQHEVTHNCQVYEKNPIWFSNFEKVNLKTTVYFHLEDVIPG